MPDIKIKQNAREIVKRIDAAQMGYHYAIMQSMTHTLDNIRRTAAEKYLLKDKGPGFYNIQLDDGKWRSRFRSKAPADKVRLTNRTGLLKRTLTEGTAWSRQKAGSKLQGTRYLVATVKPRESANHRVYYLGSITFRHDQDIRYRYEHEERGDRAGRKRFFLTPAAREFGNTGLERMVQNVALKTLDKAI